MDDASAELSELLLSWWSEWRSGFHVICRTGGAFRFRGLYVLLLPMNPSRRRKGAGRRGRTTGGAGWAIAGLVSLETVPPFTERGFTEAGA